jgi:hypothetical protein
MSRKPEFFSYNMPLYEVVTPDGLMRPVLAAKRGGLYCGGSARQVSRSCLLMLVVHVVKTTRGVQGGWAGGVHACHDVNITQIIVIRCEVNLSPGACCGAAILGAGGPGCRPRLC